jgi:hypothetical protein
MTKFKVGDRVYNIRRYDRSVKEGFGRIMWIEGTRAKLQWEDNGKDDGVECRDLISEDEAVNEGLT